MTEASSVLYNNIVTNFTERGALMADKDIKNEELAAIVKMMITNIQRIVKVFAAVIRECSYFNAE